MDLCELTATQALAMMRRGEVSAVELAEALLRRIDALEPTLHAWEVVDREGALAAARRCVEDSGRGEDAGLLRGLPLGVKDIFFTKGLPTTGGSPILRGFTPTYEATSVARLREAGGIVLGKTVTVQWAFADPPRTRNPWALERTPGGSSSGSAAAVAARMVPAAVGTQTGGSVLRPAAFTGIVGLKPSYGRISRHGVIPSGWSLDHVGALARSVEDAALLLQTMAGHDPLDSTSADVAPSDYLLAARGREKGPVLGLVPDYLEAATTEVSTHVAEVAARFERAGAEIREIRLPQPLPDLVAIRNLINQVEAASLHASLVKEHPEGFQPRIRAMVEVGHAIPGHVYLHAQRLRRSFRPQVNGMLQGVDALLMPTVDTVAPERSSTGSSAFQAVWSLFGHPSISLPSGLSRERLPLAIQLVSRSFREDTLLSVARWCESALDPMPSPL